MVGRVPTNRDVASLTREEWEDLCAGICSEVFQAQRVEDHLGRGNGMDGWRSIPKGAEGFQHRRFDDRFERDQLNELKRNLALAVDRAKTEIGARLVGYHVCINVDLQPGHMGAPGEIELWREFEQWARSTHKVAVELHSLTWVTTKLKQFPYIRPDLFEDLNEALEDVRQELARKVDENQKTSERVLELVEKLANVSTVEARLKQLLVKLAHEARLAFDRAMKHGDEEQFIEAISKLDDARRLLEGDQIDERLRGHVLLLLCGMKVMIGRLSEAISDGESAIKLLSGLGDEELLRLARGNLAMALYKLQRYDEASAVCEELLALYEADGNISEVVRTLQNLAEMCCNSRDIKRAMIWAERLKSASHTLVQLQGGISILDIAALGTYANVLVAAADLHDIPQDVEREMLQEALRTLRRVEKMIDPFSPMSAVIARTQIAKCLWGLKEFEQADVAFQRAISDADTMSLGKVAADARFNRGLMLSSLGRVSEAQQDLLDARRRYVDLGDPPSVADVDNSLKQISGK